MALLLNPATRERRAKQMDEKAARAIQIEGAWASWRPVPRSEPEPPEHTDMFIKGYVD